jgi:hypothetical protein
VQALDYPSAARISAMLLLLCFMILSLTYLLQRDFSNPGRFLFPAPPRTAPRQKPSRS